MRDTKMVDWHVPAGTWETFREYVEDRFGGIDGYLGREVEFAMRQYSDTDGGEYVEELVDELVQAAGRTPEEAYEQKTSLEDAETTRVTVRVDEQVKHDFRIAADRAGTYSSYGRTLARALQTHMEGGRNGRLTRKLERVVDDASALLAELDESESEDTLKPTERRTMVICNRLPEQFPDEELVAEIADVAGDTQSTINDYRERVVERRGLEPHPKSAADLWVPEEVAREIADDGTPRECRRPVDMLDRKEKVRRLQYAAGAHAYKREGKCRLFASDIREDVFDGDLARSTVLDLMEAADRNADGFEFDRSRSGSSSGEGALLTVTLPKLGRDKPEMIDTIREFALGGEGESMLADADEPDTESGEEDVDDWGDGRSPSELDSATPSRPTAADGSGDQHDRDANPGGEE